MQKREGQGYTVRCADTVERVMPTLSLHHIRRLAEVRRL